MNELKERMIAGQKRKNLSKPFCEETFKNLIKALVDKGAITEAAWVALRIVLPEDVYEEEISKLRLTYESYKKPSIIKGTINYCYGGYTETEEFEGNIHDLISRFEEIMSDSILLYIELQNIELLFEEMREEITSDSIPLDSELQNIESLLEEIMRDSALLYIKLQNIKLLLEDGR